MARMNIYLQDDLAASVKGAELEVSAICQQALREAVEVKGKGFGVKIEELQAAVRLRGTTPQGRREAGAIDGAQWAKDVATVKDLQAIDQVIIEQEEVDDGEDPMYMVRWSDETSRSGDSHLDISSDFETLGPWMLKEGSWDLIGTEDGLASEANDHLAGFVEAAQRMWHDLQPLVDEGEAVLLRRIALLGDMERSMLTRDVSTTPAPGEAISELEQGGSEHSSS